jgi:hypothetical protein
MAKNFTATIKNQKKVEKYFNQALPDSTRFALSGTANVIAYRGVIKSNQQFKKDFTLSNKYLVGNGPGKGVLKFKNSKPHHDLNKIESSWGAHAKRGDTDLDFLVKQEDGFKHDGMIPTKHAYPSQNKDKVIKRNFRRNKIEVLRPQSANSNSLFAMRKLYLSHYAMPKSNQLIYIKKGDNIPNPTNSFNEGMYQFSSASLSGGQYPHLTKIYSKTDSVNKKRNAVGWMDKSSKSFTQTEIDAIYGKELDKSLTQAFKKL